MANGDSTQNQQQPVLVAAPGGGSGQGYYVKNPNLQYQEFIPVAAGENAGQSLQNYLNTYKGSTYTGQYQGQGGGQQQGTTMSNGVDQSNYLGNLGTLALRNVMGTNQIPVGTNPQPQGSSGMSIGGVQNVGSPQYSMPTNAALQQSMGLKAGQNPGVGMGSVFNRVATPQPAACRTRYRLSIGR